MSERPAVSLPKMQTHFRWLHRRRGGLKHSATDVDCTGHNQSQQQHHHPVQRKRSLPLSLFRRHTKEASDSRRHTSGSDGVAKAEERESCHEGPPSLPADEGASRCAVFPEPRVAVLVAELVIAHPRESRPLELTSRALLRGVREADAAVWGRFACERYTSEVLHKYRKHHPEVASGPQRCRQMCKALTLTHMAYANGCFNLLKAFRARQYGIRDATIMSASQILVAPHTSPARPPATFCVPFWFTNPAAAREGNPDDTSEWADLSGHTGSFLVLQPQRPHMGWTVPSKGLYPVATDMGMMSHPDYPFVLFADGKRRFVFKSLGAATLMELSTHEDQLFFTGSDKWLAGTLVAPSHHGAEGYLLMAAVCRTETDGAEDAPGQMQIGVWKVPLSMLRQRQPGDSAGGAGGSYVPLPVGPFNPSYVPVSPPPSFTPSPLMHSRTPSYSPVATTVSTITSLHSNHSYVPYGPYGRDTVSYVPHVGIPSVSPSLPHPPFPSPPIRSLPPAQPLGDEPSRPPTFRPTLIGLSTPMGPRLLRRLQPHSLLVHHAFPNLIFCLGVDGDSPVYLLMETRVKASPYPDHQSVSSTWRETRSSTSSSTNSRGWEDVGTPDRRTSQTASRNSFGAMGLSALARIFTPQSHPSAPQHRPLSRTSTPTSPRSPVTAAECKQMTSLRRPTWERGGLHFFGLSWVGGGVLTDPPAFSFLAYGGPGGPWSGFHWHVEIDSATGTCTRVSTWQYSRTMVPNVVRYAPSCRTLVSHRMSGEYVDVYDVTMLRQRDTLGGPFALAVPYCLASISITSSPERPWPIPMDGGDKTTGKKTRRGALALNGLAANVGNVVPVAVVCSQPTLTTYTDRPKDKKTKDKTSLLGRALGAAISLTSDHIHEIQPLPCLELAFYSVENTSPTSKGGGAGALLSVVPVPLDGGPEDWRGGSGRSPLVLEADVLFAVDDSVVVVCAEIDYGDGKGRQGFETDWRIYVIEVDTRRVLWQSSASSSAPVPHQLRHFFPQAPIIPPALIQWFTAQGLFPAAQSPASLSFVPPVLVRSVHLPNMAVPQMPLAMPYNGVIFIPVPSFGPASREDEQRHSLMMVPFHSPAASVPMSHIVCRPPMLPYGRPPPRALPYHVPALAWPPVAHGPVSAPPSTASLSHVTSTVGHPYTGAASSSGGSPGALKRSVSATPRPVNEDAVGRSPAPLHLDLSSVPTAASNGVAAPHAASSSSFDWGPIPIKTGSTAGPTTPTTAVTRCSSNSPPLSATPPATPLERSVLRGGLSGLDGLEINRGRPRSHVRIVGGMEGVSDERDSDSLMGGKEAASGVGAVAVQPTHDHRFHQ